MSSLWPRVADLPLEVERYELERLQRDVSSAFTRVSTVLHLHGPGGTVGLGEDVSYDAEDQQALQDAGPVQPLAGRWTVASFAEALAGLDLWPEPARHEASRRYRVWAYESAALDLALQQAGRGLAEVLGRTPRPVHFVVSLRLGSPASLAPLRARLDVDPGLRFKLDPTPDWTDEVVAGLVATGAVESLDFKGHYVGSLVETPPDADLYRRLLAAFPQAWIEDPHPTPEIEALVAPHADRVSWDAPIHAIGDIEDRPFPARMVNVKPSRIGSLRDVLDTYAYCEAHGIGMYGGGQFELGVGRGHIQALASLFHPDGANDVAPGGFNDPEPPAGLPSSPLPVALAPVGFRWG